MVRHEKADESRQIKLSVKGGFIGEVYILPLSNLLNMKKSISFLILILIATNVSSQLSEDFTATWEDFEDNILNIFDDDEQSDIWSDAFGIFFVVFIIYLGFKMLGGIF